MVAVFIFFVAVEHLPNLQGEPRLLQGYDVTEVHAYGAQNDSENCTGRGEKRAANLGTSTQTWPCGNRLGARDHAIFAVRVGR
jgi:hypothetical protein